MSLRFGTDGVRARAHDVLTTEWVRGLARAAAPVLAAEVVAIGHDGRESGPAFVEALSEGFAAAGVETWIMGRVPTPAVAHAAAAHGVAGAMVSASHNPWHDNGVKFFAPGGRKLTDAMQAAIETALDGIDAPPARGGSSGSPRPDLAEEWAEHVIASIDGRRLDGVVAVVDCANGASSGYAPNVLERLGASVTVLHDRPDGRNINEGAGSTNPDALRRAVIAQGADVGVAFDGDADRVLTVAADGTLVDGDHEIAICAHDLHRRGILADDTVVVTVMTNLGFRLAMEEAGIAIHETPVGDRHVLETLEEHGWSLGGEQSGHVIFADLATTGDGLLTAIQLLDVMVRTGRTLGDLAADAMTRLPQVLENITLNGSTAELMPELAVHIAAVEAELGSRGRVLVRPSGTEPLLRIMVEASTEAVARTAVDRLLKVVRAHGTR